MVMVQAALDRWIGCTHGMLMLFVKSYGLAGLQLVWPVHQHITSSGKYSVTIRPGKSGKVGHPWRSSPYSCEPDPVHALIM